jgi:hypothetical protein
MTDPTFLPFVPDIVKTLAYDSFFLLGIARFDLIPPDSGQAFILGNQRIPSWLREEVRGGLNKMTVPRDEVPWALQTFTFKKGL